MEIACEVAVVVVVECCDEDMVEFRVVVEVEVVVDELVVLVMVMLLSEIGLD